MADLGTLTIRDVPPFIPTRLPVPAYQIVRGHFLGEIGTRDVPPTIPDRPTAVNYIVRQLIVVYRQLWPSHGQRFPQ